MKTRLLTGLIATAGFLASGSAFAVGDFEQPTDLTKTDEFGNYNFYGKYYYSSDQYNEQRTDYQGNVIRRSQAIQSLWAVAQAFGTYVYPINVQSSGYGYHIRQATGDTYARYVYASAEFLGDELYREWGTKGSCTGNRACASFETSTTKTLFNAEGHFVVGFVPVTVKARVSGGLHAGLTAEAYSAAYLGTVGTTYTQGSATLNAGASATANLSAYAGIEDVLGVGVTVRFKILAVDVTPEASARMAGPMSNGSINAAWVNRAPLTISTLDGTAKVWADITPLWSPEVTLISWDGYSWARTLYDSSSNRYYY